MSINSKMKAIADEVRELSGTTGAMGLDDMATHIGEANADIASQAELIAQIQTALAGKVAGGIDTSDATATASDIFSGETAYVNGSKVTGTFSIDNELTTQDSLITQIQAAVDNLPEASGGSVETCTVTITDAFADGTELEIIATTVVNGVETPYIFLHDVVEGNTTSPPYTIENVKCGSIITIVRSEAFSAVPYVETNNGSTLIKACRISWSASTGEAALMYVFTAPTIANVHSTITVDCE